MKKKPIYLCMIFASFSLFFGGYLQSTSVEESSVDTEFIETQKVSEDIFPDTELPFEN